MNVALCRFDSFSESDKELLGNQGEMRKLEGRFDRATEFVIGECKWGIAKRLFFIKQTFAFKTFKNSFLWAFTCPPISVSGYS